MKPSRKPIGRFLTIVGVCAAVVSSGGIAAGSELNPFLGATITLEAEGDTFNVSVPAATDGSSTATVPDDGASGAGWAMDWTGVSFDADPFIAGNFAVTNAMAGPQTFILTVTMPTNFLTGGSTTIDGGSALTIADANFDSSASMSTLAPESIYSAEINGGTVARTLFDDVYNLSSPASPGAVNGDFGNYFGEAGPAVGLITDVTIVHTFIVSGNDKATVNSTFNIVPEPTTLAVLSLGSIFVIRRRNN